MLNPSTVARNDDPVSSHLAAVDSHGRVSQRNRLLLAFALGRQVLSDEQAAELAGVSPRSCWWKRCSELRETGMISPVVNDYGNQVHVTSSQGKQVMVSAVTPQGLQYLRSEGLFASTTR